MRTFGNCDVHVLENPLLFVDYRHGFCRLLRPGNETLLWYEVAYSECAQAVGGQMWSILVYLLSLLVSRSMS